MSYEDINCYGKRQIRRKDIINLQNLIDKLPELPEVLEDKTYTLKLVNGELKWIEQE